MQELEVPLVGGRANVVVRRGNVVHRTVYGDRTVQRMLLTHLGKKGFDAAPRFLGMDESGREMLTFLEGDTVSSAAALDAEQLAGAARLLRRYHEMTVDFPPVVAAGTEVMCHNDWNPTNAVLRDGTPACMIDFDCARPGSRLWDLSYSAWRWLGIGEAGFTADEQFARLDNFLRGYEPGGISLAQILPVIVARQTAVWRWMKTHRRFAPARWTRRSMEWTAEHMLDRILPVGFFPVPR